MKIEDYESALNPDEFLMFSETIRNCSDAFGEATNVDDFGMSEEEYNYRKMIRRHVVTNKCLEKGAEILPGDLSLKRTSSENVLTRLEDVYSKNLKHDMNENSPIMLEDIE